MNNIYTNLADQVFLGKKIRLGLPAVDPRSGNQILEFLQIKISHKISQTDELLGQIIEEPNYISNYRFGDVIAFHKSEISEMCSEGSC